MTDRLLEAIASRVGDDFDLYSAMMKSEEAVRRETAPQEMVVPPPKQASKIPTLDDEPSLPKIQTVIDMQTAVTPVRDEFVSVWLKGGAAVLPCTPSITFFPTAYFNEDRRKMYGYMWTVLLHTTALNVPMMLLYVDELFYGMCAVAVPRPDECEGRTKAFYACDTAQLRRALDAVQFGASSRDDFIGVFEQVEDVGDGFLTRRWVIVQEGDEAACEKLTTSIFKHKIGGFYQMFKEGSPLYVGTARDAIRKKREKHVFDVLSAFDVTKDVFPDSVTILHQERHGFYVNTERTMFSLMCGVFVPNGANFLVWNGPQRGFTYFTEIGVLGQREQYNHAVPYDTGFEAGAEYRTVKRCVEDAYGNDHALLDGRYHPLDSKFRAAMRKLGFTFDVRVHDVIPLVVRMFDPIE